MKITFEQLNQTSYESLLALIRQHAIPSPADLGEETHYAPPAAIHSIGKVEGTPPVYYDLALKIDPVFDSTKMSGFLQGLARLIA